MKYVPETLLVLVAVALAYANALTATFQFDDYNVIVDNPAVHAWPAYLADLGGIRPLLKLSYLTNWVFDPSPYGFHLFNVLIHAVNSLLLFALGLAACRCFLSIDAARQAALAAALIFALHPAQTEAVTYISGRSNALMTCFYLASLLVYVHGRERRSRLLLYVASPLLFLLAALTKEVAITLPLALILWETCLAEDRPTVKGIIALQWPHWLMLLLFVAAASMHAGYHELISASAPLETLLTQVHGIGYLLSRWFVIGGLNIDPDLRLQPAWTIPLAFQATALLVLALLGVWSLRRRPWLAFGILWLFLQLAPGNSLVVRWDIANERQLYLASAGPCLAAGIALARLRIKPPGFMRVGFIALCMLLATFTLLRNDDYRSEISLWQDTVRKSPGKARPHNNLGYAYQLAGHYDMARAAYQRALDIKPDFLAARVNLLKLDGRADEHD